MFCTQCGTQVDEGKNFCKNCGARVGRAAEPMSGEGEAKAVPSGVPLETAASASSAEASHRRAQPMPAAPSRDNGGSNKLIILAAGVGVIVLAAAGVYFGTDLLKPPANQTPPHAADPMAKATEAPPLPSFEEAKDAGATADNSAASVNPPLPAEPTPPPPAEAPKPPPEILPKRAPRADVPPPPAQSQIQRAGQETPAPGRATRPQPPVPASRGGMAAGIYETRRATTVYEEPSASAKTVASIPPGTRVNVVSASGDWLEVHSKRGNPPGFIRRDDATFIEKSN